jgi:hypothetical protein
MCCAYINLRGLARSSTSLPTSGNKNSFFTSHSFFRMNVPVPVTSIETLPTELLEWLGEKKIKPGDGDLWVRKTLEIQKDFAFLFCL